jgi:hypothetical protein
MLLEIEEYLAEHGGLGKIAGVRDIAELRASHSGGPFVFGVLWFKWCAAFDVDPVQDAIKKQAVEFEVDREANDDAGTLSLPVRMTGSLGKCVHRKNLFDGSLSGVTPDSGG